MIRIRIRRTVTYFLWGVEDPGVVAVLEGRADGARSDREANPGVESLGAGVAENYWVQEWLRITGCRSG